MTLWTDIPKTWGLDQNRNIFERSAFGLKQICLLIAESDRVRGIDKTLKVGEGQNGHVQPTPAL